MKNFVLKYTISSIIFIVVQVSLQIFVSETVGKILTQLMILLLIGILLKPYLIATRNDSDKNDLNLVKKQRREKCKLYIRLGEEFDTDLFVYKIVGDLEGANDDLSDIRVFKAKMVEKLGPNLNDYYLIREVVELKLKSGFLNFLGGFAKQILISSITVIISGLFINNMITIINKGGNMWGLLELLIQLIISVILILVLIHLFYIGFKGTKNRALLLKSILDLIIKEKEKEGSKHLHIY
ncbi:hypothetical protein FH508_0013215 [Lysinibacillus sp. CD3-6]|uniref:hypothetical protein n=1 Tax=Lysinibacillus sp. CD3-6 TaxID=2892541 RepID=UPI00116E0229|nr:hypothetical protein [Lysinibacillus sp. CD3-6]UED78425.1 hypothetical protein FH508_0013215 [Lysinibacillus sp. CD3-6]